MSDEKIINVNFQRELKISPERLKKIMNALIDINAQYAGIDTQLQEDRFFMELLGTSIVGFAKLHANAVSYLENKKTVDEQADELVFIYKNMLEVFINNKNLGEISIVLE